VIELCNTMQCTTFFGKKKEISDDKITLRPAAYGVVLHEGKILLVRTKHTSKYFFPGGGMEQGENLEQCLRREMKEETGIEICDISLLHFNESFFYYDPLDEAFHCFSFFFLCKSKSLSLKGQADDTECEKPCWVDLNQLKEEDFQPPGGEVLKLVMNL